MLCSVSLGTLELDENGILLLLSFFNPSPHTHVCTHTRTHTPWKYFSKVSEISCNKSTVTQFFILYP